MPTININDLDMYYEQQGQGEDLLLITGLNANHLMWANVVPQLSKKYHVTIIDNRGAGLTSAPEGLYTTKQMAEDTLAFIEAIGLQKPHVVGHSMGGTIAQQLAIHHGNKVNKLMLYATAAKFDARCMFALDEQLALRERGASEVEIARLIGLTWCMSLNYIANPNNIEQFLQMAANNPYPMTLNGSRGQSAACRDHDARDTVSLINNPTLVFAPEQDILAPVRESEFLTERIPNAQLDIIEHQAHCWHLEDPTGFIERVQAFIG